jgi:hypothetical protein
MPRLGWIGPCSALAATMLPPPAAPGAALVGEQVDRVRRVVPQQVVGPGARLAQCVHVRAAEEVGLHVHLLDVEFAGANLLVDPLVAGVEAPRVAAHGDQPGLLLQREHGFGVGQAVGQRDLDLHVLAGLQAGDGLLGVHLGRRAQDHGVDFLHGQAVGQVGADVADAVLGGGLARLVQFAADQRDHLDAVDQLDRVEMLDAEGAGAGQRDLDGLAHLRVLQDQVSNGGVRRGYMVEAVRTRGRPPVAGVVIAPRAISHITSSMPSEPASRT